IAKSSVNMPSHLTGSRFMLISCQRRLRVAPPAVGLDGRPGGHILGQKLTDALFIGPQCRGQPEPTSFFPPTAFLITPANHLDGPQNQRLVLSNDTPTTRKTSRRPTHKGFVGFDHALKLAPRFIDHCSAEPMQHIPRRLVTTAQLPLELLGTQARRVGGDKVNRPEPLADGHMGILQERASRRRHFKTTTTTLM